MKHFFPLLLLLSLAGCAKDDPALPNDAPDRTVVCRAGDGTRSAPEPGTLALGEQLENPFSLENMQEAMTALRSRSLPNAGLVPKRIDTNIYNLAKELFAGRTSSALEILNDVFAQNTEPIMILSTLSGHFTDLYRAKLGSLAKKSSYDAAKAFKYPPNRSFVMDSAYRSVGRLSECYLGDCVAVLYKTNKLLNSSKADKRQLIEQAIIEIAALVK